jgi:hypothetical protein
MSKKPGLFSSNVTDRDDTKEIPVPPELSAPVPAPVVTPAPAAAAPAPMVALDVYCRLGGRKPDQVKAFVKWAQRQGLTALTLAEWGQQWEKFQARPV